MPYSDDQKAIARSLLGKPKTLEELRDELGVPANALLEALKGMIKLGVIEKAGTTGKYKLIDQVLTGVGQKKVRGGETTEARDEGEAKGPFKVKMIIEGASRTKDALEFQMAEIEKKLRKEKVQFGKFDRSSVEEQEGNFTMFIDTEIFASSLKSVVNLIINYGPTYVELLEPKKVELSMSETQETMNLVVQAVHYYVNLILQFQQNLLDASKGKAESEGQ